MFYNISLEHYKCKHNFFFFFFCSAQKEIQNIEVTQINYFLPAQETDQNESNVKLVELKNAVIKHMYFAEVSNS